MQLHQILLLSIASQTTVAQRLVEAGSLVILLIFVLHLKEMCKNIKNDMPFLF